MRIGIVSHIANAKSGARAPMELAKALAHHGEDVFFYATTCGYDHESVKNLKDQGVKVRLIESEDYLFIGKFRSVLRLKNQLLKDSSEILSLHCTPPFFLGSMLSRIPTILTYHGTQFGVLRERLLPYSPLIVLFLPLELFLNFVIWTRNAIYMWGANRVIAISRYTKHEARNLYKKSSKVVYWGAKPGHFAISKSQGKSQGKICQLLTVSRFTPYKNFHLLLEIFKSLEKSTKIPLRFTIAGSLGSAKYLEYLKSIAPQNVSFQVNRTDEELSLLYQQSDIYVTADTYLFFGMPVLEAASFGVPVVAYNFGAASELIDNGKTGFVVSTKIGFEKVLRQLVENKDRREKMSRLAQEKAQQDFTWEKTAIQYLEIFKKHYKKLSL